MRATDAIHPSPEQLSAFALGKLGDADIAAVAEHLAGCAACRAAAGAATDSFLDLLRASRATTAAGGPGQTSPAETSGRPDRPPDLGPTAVPAELCDHPRYRFLRFLGQGGMGTVYLAEHKVMKQPRAVKVIKQALTGNPRAAERFAKEIELLAKLRHAHIVQAYDAEQAGDLHFLVMEYVEGQSLAAVLKQRGPLPVGLACDYARQAALGLQYAHEQGLVHRDLKPANLLLTREELVKVLDFGLGRLADEYSGSSPALTDEHALLGTPEYMSPEQILGARAADARADIYSLGCTLFCLLAGRPPFPGTSGMEVALARLQHPPPSLRELRPDVPAELSGLVGRMLAKKPEQRPQTAGEVVKGLAPFVRQAAAPGVTAAARADAAPATGPAPGRQGPPSPFPGRRLLWAGVTLGLLAALGLALWRARVLPTSAGPTKEPTQVSPEEFLSLFNGKDLSGWRTWGGGTGGWEVEDGAIVSRGKCAILYSERGDFEDFHLRAEALSAGGGRSGIFFRSPYTPHDPAAYVAGINAANPDPQRTGSLRDIAPVGEQLHGPDEWFTLEVIARGEHIVTKVNGRVTADCRNRSFKKGYLALWNDAGGAVKFRGIDVKPLPPARQPFGTPAGDARVPLFNGKDLAGWQAPSGGTGGWDVEDGILVARGPVQNLYTEYGHFEDFHLRAEAMINDGGFARISFRAPWAPHPGVPQAYYAVLNATHPSPEGTGSLAGLVPVGERLHPPDEWITLEVIARGNRVTIKVNGKTTVDREEPRFRTGHVLLEQRTPGSEIRFRKIEIKEVPPEK